MFITLLTHLVSLPMHYYYNLKGNCRKKIFFLFQQYQIRFIYLLIYHDSLICLPIHFALLLQPICFVSVLSVVTIY